MIKIERVAAPAELTAEVVTDLTNQFKADDKKSVWNKDYIRQGLLRMSHGKCAYCECDVREESKYLEVEHFRCKDPHADLVVHWRNLLPSCKRCNVNKGTHDVDIDGMIVNPSEDNPREHLSLRSYRLRGKDEIGHTTIRTLYLNDSDRVVRMRFDLGEQVIINLETVRDMLEAYIAGPQTAYRRGKIISTFTNTLREAQPNSVYSATVATVLVQQDDYPWIIEHMRDAGLWNDELDALTHQAEQLALV